MTDNSQCPDAERWTSFLDGDATDEATVKLAAHLEDCEACQQTLERLAAGKETWEGTAKQLAEAEAANAPAASEEESSGHLRDVLDDLKQGADVGPTGTASSNDVLRFLEPSDEPGSIGRLDSYEILEVVGAGGMGVVLRGWDPTLRRIVAIKVLASHLANSAAAERRFVREAQAAAAVSHDHVVAIHAVESEHEPPYLVMQFIEGKTLQQRLDSSGALDVKEILRIGQQTALGLAAAHRQGIVHRDIKPANILLENGVERVRITDFGLARAIDDASMTQSGVVAGTPLFMAPEQAQGQPIDHRADLFSLGSVLYAMATGRPPFRSSTMMGVIRRVCDDQPRPIREINPDIPDWLCGIIDRLLAKNPDDRFQSADKVAELLAGCLAHVQHPLSVSLPAAAFEAGRKTTASNEAVSVTGSQLRSSTSAAAQVAFSDVPQPTVEFPATAQPMADSVAVAGRSVDDVDSAARDLVKWPATLLFITGLINLLSIVAILLYLMGEIGSEANQVLARNLWTLVPCGLCMIGAIRMGSLRSRVWGYVAVVTALLGGPGIVLGLPVGIWALSRLGRPEVIAAFNCRSSSDWEEPTPPVAPLTFGQHLARIMIIGALLLLAIAIPLVSIVLAQDSGAFPGIGLPEKTMLSFAALAVVFGLAALLRLLERQRTAATRSATSRPTMTQQIRRVPEVLICTLLSVFTMQAIYADLTTSHYDRFLEAAVMPLFCVTIAALGIVVFINRRRIRELKESGREDAELTSAYRTAISVPVGLLIPVLVLLAVWTHRQSSVGYVTFDIEDPMSKVTFRNAETGATYGWVAMWKRCRLPVGKYMWSVSEGLMENMVIETGTIDVQPGIGRVLSVRIDQEETLRRLIGTWKYVSGTVNWDSADESPPAWAQPPKLLSISPGVSRERQTMVFISAEHVAARLENGAAGYACEFRADSNPKRVSLLLPNPDVAAEDWPTVASGYWRVGQNGLYLMLRPPGQPPLPSSYSVPIGRYVHYQFERVVDESGDVETKGLAESVDRSREQQLLEESIRMKLFEAEVLAVKESADSAQTHVEISAGSEDGLRIGDTLKILSRGDAKSTLAGKIRLKLIERNRSVGVVTERSLEITIESGDRVQLVSRVAH